MTTPTSSSIGIPAGVARRGSRRVSAAALQELEEPRPPGGWNTLERFASSYQRSTTFFRIDAGSPGSSIGFHGSYRPGVPGFEHDFAVVDDDEETALLGGRRSTRPSHSHYRTDDSGSAQIHFGRAGSPKLGDEIHESIRRGSRRASMLTELGVPELLIKEVQDEAGNIIEVVVGQVMSFWRKS